MYPGNTTFRYLNTGILSLTGVCNVSAFLGRFDITELGDIPYTFNWIVYSDSTGPISSFTTRSIFTFDLLDRSIIFKAKRVKIYFSAFLIIGNIGDRAN